MQSKNNTTFIVIGSVTAVIAVAFLLIGPGVGGFGIRNDQGVEATCEDFEVQQTIAVDYELRVGEEVNILLCSDPSTGNRWSIPQIANQNVVEIDLYEFIDGVEFAAATPEGSGRGLERWRLKARTTGQSTISSTYEPVSGDGDGKGWRHIMNLTVLE